MNSAVLLLILEVTIYFSPNSFRISKYFVEIYRCVDFYVYQYQLKNWGLLDEKKNIKGQHIHIKKY